MLRSAALLLACMATGCATSQPTSNTLADLTRLASAPGSTFATIEEAAFAGLAACYVASRHDRGRARVRAGVVRAVAGGFTYGEIAQATRLAAQHVEFALPADAVAHFRHYPATGDPRTDRRNAEHSAQDRQVVDELDPLHRPSFLLNPRLDVRIYSGTSDLTVANLRTWNGSDPRLAAVARPPR